MKDQGLKQIIKIIKALADENRARIINLLKNKKDICVCEITRIIGLAQPTISSHLKLLENAGLIESNKNGLWVNYNIVKSLDLFSSEFIEMLCKNIENDKQIKADEQMVKKINRETICRKQAC
jgi:ArsR family transcriptional regulator, arsenate/arsenite/antimonite-responsive transcriptional repressor